MAALEPLLSEASVAVGHLDGSASTLLNPDLFVAMYVRREAVLSIPVASRELGIAFNTATRAVNQLKSMGMLEEMTGSQRNKRYQYTPYLKLFLDDHAVDTPRQGETSEIGARHATQHE